VSGRCEQHDLLHQLRHAFSRSGAAGENLKRDQH
jgi:hypothetical protein